MYDYIFRSNGSRFGWSAGLVGFNFLLFAIVVFIYPQLLAYMIAGLFGLIGLGILGAVFFTWRWKRKFRDRRAQFRRTIHVS